MEIQVEGSSELVCLLSASATSYPKCAGKGEGEGEGEEGEGRGRGKGKGKVDRASPWFLSAPLTQRASCMYVPATSTSPAGVGSVVMKTAGEAVELLGGSLPRASQSVSIHSPNCTDCMYSYTKVGVLYCTTHSQ